MKGMILNYLKDLTVNREVRLIQDLTRLPSKGSCK